MSNRCVLNAHQTPRAATTPGGSSTATATVTSAGDTRGRMPRRTAGSTAATWPAFTAQPSRTSSEVSGEVEVALPADTAMETGPVTGRLRHFCSPGLTYLSVHIELRGKVDQPAERTDC